jgi:dipeptidyl aminopeptidase/acylaminoacyl peptidase
MSAESLKIKLTGRRAAQITPGAPLCYQRLVTATPFDNLDHYLALPRVSGLAVSADGSRVVTTVAELNDTGSEYVSAIWEVDPGGERPARRLIRGCNGESAPAFTPDGDVLFISSRPTAGTADDADKPPASLWRLPAAGGEAIEALSMPGGIEVVRTARSADAVIVGAPLLPAALDVDDDRRLRDLRKASKVNAILHSGYPVRFWNSDIGPDEPHLFDAAGPRDLTPQPGGALRQAGFDDATFDISADGRFLVTTWRITGPGPTERTGCCGSTWLPASAAWSPTIRTPTSTSPRSRRTGRRSRSPGKPLLLQTMLLE